MLKIKKKTIERRLLYKNFKVKKCLFKKDIFYDIFLKFFI